MEGGVWKLVQRKKWKWNSNQSDSSSHFSQATLKTISGNLIGFHFSFAPVLINITHFIDLKNDFQGHS